MNIDKEIEVFLQKERKIFEEEREIRFPCQEEEGDGIGKEEFKNTITRQKLLKEKWKEGKKEIEVACHNINGLKTKGWKLENLLGWAEEEEIAILGIIETNITEREGRFLTHAASKNYIGYWSNAAEDKKKGLGVGILIKEQWEKHVGAVKRISKYMMEIMLYFKQLKLVVIGVYISPNNKTIEKNI
jgi:hypothetical protein